MRKIQFVENEYYHIYNRGVEKRDVFLDHRDYERFIYFLFACNDTAPLLNSQFHYRGLASIVTHSRKRNRLVDIICFCLMPNHYHLILRQHVEQGISRFMQKIGTGYTMYFNTRNKRSGVLFQGIFKAIHIDKQEYLNQLTRYIHLNPAEIRDAKWKKKSIKDHADVYEFVKKYPWSSYADYLDQGRFAPLLNMNLIKDLSPAPVQYEQFIKEWVDEHGNLISDYTIEVSPL